MGTPPGNDPPRLLAASDRTLLVRLGEQADPSLRLGVLRLQHLLDGEPPAGLIDLSPAYASVLVRFDPLVTDHEQVAAHVRRLLGSLDQVPLPDPRLVEIPVCYGGAFGPDLDEVARFASLPPEQVIGLHAGATYEVHFLGFTPGFAYLGTVHESIACPRLPSPRRVVPAGSVGIAGPQTGVYPMSSPGGWRLIGRTPLRMFDAGRTPMSLLEPGDRVRFVPRAWEDFEEAPQ